MFFATLEYTIFCHENYRESGKNRDEEKWRMIGIGIYMEPGAFPLLYENHEIHAFPLECPLYRLQISEKLKTDVGMGNEEYGRNRE